MTIASVMEGIAENVRAAAESFERIERDRDLAITRSRRVIRLSKMVIHAIHVGEDHGGELEEIETALDELLSAETPEVLLSGVTQDAMMEYAEALILESIVTGSRVPSESDLGISASAWILGLADCVGELRRIVTARLMEGDLDGARRYFDAMEAICEELMLLDVPDAIAPVRRKQDIARGIMDRTRSDMTTASIMAGRNRF